MKSLTLHSLDDQLADVLKRRAKEESVSMNELAKRLLAQAFGIKSKDRGRHIGDFTGFCGAWGAKDVKQFAVETEDMEKVNPEDWR